MGSLWNCLSCILCYTGKFWNKNILFKKWTSIWNSTKDLTDRKVDSICIIYVPIIIWEAIHVVYEGAMVRANNFSITLTKLDQSMTWVEWKYIIHGTNWSI